MTSTKEHWEGVYRSKAPDQVSWYQHRPDVSLELIARAAADAPPGIIDVGGGASTLVDHLLEAGYGPLTVLDISGAALDHSRRRLGSQAAQVEWIEGDVRTFEPRHRFGIWHDRAVFHFLVEETDRRAYVHSLDRCLERGGALVIATFALDGPARCSGLPVQRHDEASLQRELGPSYEWMESRRFDHSTPGGSLQRFLYVHFRRTRDRPPAV